MVKFKEPAVRLVNSFDGKIEAWAFSRPGLDLSTLDVRDLEKMDLSINGFASYHFEVTGSLLLRDLILSIRPIVPWASSNRRVPFTRDNLVISQEYAGMDDEFMSDRLEEIFSRLANREPQDLVKKRMPMACSTDFSISIDDRTLVAFLQVLRIHAPDLYLVYGTLFLKAIGKDDSYVANRNCADIYSKLAVSANEFGAVNTTHEYLETFVGVYRVSANLMAQFIRQHYSPVKNQLFNLIHQRDLKGLARLSCDDEIVVAVYADKQSFRKVQSVRTCWFAQFDKEDNSSWSSILKPYVEKLTSTEFAERLPCHGKCDQCGIVEDMMPRVDGIEVNPPCPILIEDPSLIKTRQEKYGSNSAVFDQWQGLFDNGHLSDNPGNELRKRYESVIAEKGLPE